MSSRAGVVSRGRAIVVCYNCTVRVCLSCNVAVTAGMHEGRSCAEARSARLADLAGSQGLGSAQLARLMPCPTCGHPYDKDVRCMHVECPDCKTRFSWCCGRTDPEHPAYHCPYGRPVVHTHTQLLASSLPQWRSTRRHHDIDTWRTSRWHGSRRQTV